MNYNSIRHECIYKYERIIQNKRENLLQNKENSFIIYIHIYIYIIMRSVFIEQIFLWPMTKKEKKNTCVSIRPVKKKWKYSVETHGLTFKKTSHYTYKCKYLFRWHIIFFFCFLSLTIDYLAFIKLLQICYN